MIRNLIFNTLVFNSKKFNKCSLLLCSTEHTGISIMNNDSTLDSSKRKHEEIDNGIKKTKLSCEEETPIDTLLEKVAERSNRERKPKKVVLLLSYLGKEYFGMQRNNNVNTIEEELFKALLESGIILKDEFDFPKNMKFQRAARTDKGVSAIKNIVSLKIPLKDIVETFPEKVNRFLPPNIRVVAIKRVTQSFDAKIACDARTYSYMLPTFAFSAPAENPEEYRITSEKIDEVNDFLKKYLGTHNFYNFTSGRLAGDPSCKRYIMSCECGQPFQSQGLELCVIEIKGQSFMLHQIRKMVGLAIAFMHNLAPPTILQKAWQNERLDIPKAPGLGLMLEDLHYDWYNSKYGSDGMHEPLKWELYEKEIEKFKKEKICANIAQTEREEKSMLQWLQTLPHHSYDVREDGPPTMSTSKTETPSIVHEPPRQTETISLPISNAESSVRKSEASPLPIHSESIVLEPPAENLPISNSESNFSPISNLKSSFVSDAKAKVIKDES